MITNIGVSTDPFQLFGLILGLDGATFLRFLRLLRNAFSFIAIVVTALLVVDIIYNLKYVPCTNRNFLSLLSIQNVSGKWVWTALAGSYVISEFQLVSVS